MQIEPLKIYRIGDNTFDHIQNFVAQLICMHCWLQIQPCLFRKPVNVSYF